MADPKRRQEMSRYILEAVARINPHNRSEGRIGYIWAAGFLAGFLAHILCEDPILFRKFRNYIESKLDNRR